MLTMKQFNIKMILWKVKEITTQEMIDCLVKIVESKKEEEFLNITKQKPPRTKADLNLILKQL